MAVVGAPDYFKGRKHPRTPQDLTEHNCINLRLPTAGGLYAWEFEKGGRELRVRVEGRLAFNTATMAVSAALAGDGLAFVPEDRVREHGPRSGRLVPAFSRLSSLLPEPAATDAGVRRAGRRAPASRLNSR
jgi:DNA-binding transcriptional LysR family regulator